MSDTATKASSTATMIGLLAIAMWALLALLTDLTGQVPPFLLNGLAFSVATLVGLVAARVRGVQFGDIVPALPVAVTGIAGLFGYHALYFTALRNAPVIEASLIAYLWPLLIVIGSALLPGERLRWFHSAGALLGLAGAALIVTRGGTIAFDPAYLPGYLAALGCALTWSTYSLMSRRFSAVPTDVVTLYCAATAVLSFVCHGLFEQTVWPQDAGQWLAVLALGLLPVGVAFYVWDHGVKRGNIQLLGVASYAAPLLSTLVLIAMGRGVAGWPVIVACVLITAGALLASQDMLFNRDREDRPS